MTRNIAAQLCIDVRQYLTPLQLQRLQWIANSGSFSAAAYQELNSAGVLAEQDVVVLRLSPAWLSIPWHLLRDGYRFPTLQQPLALILRDSPPPQPLQRALIRILLTTSSSLVDAEDEAARLQIGDYEAACTIWYFAQEYLNS